MTCVHCISSRCKQFKFVVRELVNKSVWYRLKSGGHFRFATALETLEMENVRHSPLGVALPVRVHLLHVGVVRARHEGLARVWRGREGARPASRHVAGGAQA